MTQSIRSVFSLFAVILAASAVCAATPEEEFAAALKAGKPLSAEAAYRKMVEANPKLPAVRHYMGAQVALMCGKDLLAKDRLALFVREEKGNTLELRKALWTMVRTSQDPEVLKRLCTVAKKDDDLFNAGLAMVERLAKAERAVEMVETLAVLADAFPDSRHLGSVFGTLRWRLPGGKPGKWGEAVAKLLRAHPLMKNGDWVQVVRNYGSLLGWDGVISLAAKAGKVGDCDRALLLDAFAQVGGDETALPKIVSDLRKLESAVFAPDSSPEFALAWYGCTHRLRKAYYTDLNKDGQSAQQAEKFLKVLGMKDLWVKANLDGGVLSAFNAGIDKGAWAPEGRAKIVTALADTISCERLAAFASPKGSIAELCKAAKSGEPMAKFLKKYPDRAAEYLAWVDFLGAIEYGTRENVKTAVRTLTIGGVEGFSAWGYDNRLWHLMNTKDKITPDELADLLQSCYIRSGYTAGWGRLAAAVKSPGKNEYLANPKMQKFGASIKKEDLAGDPLLRAVRALAATKDSKGAIEAFPAVCKAYSGKFPNAATRRESGLFGWAVRFTIDRIIRDGKCFKPFLDLVLPRLTKDVCLNGNFEFGRIRDMAVWCGGESLDAYYKWREANFGEKISLREEHERFKQSVANLKTKDSAFIERIGAYLKDHDVTKTYDPNWYLAVVTECFQQNPPCAKTFKLEKLEKEVGASGNFDWMLRVFSLRGYAGVADDRSAAFDAVLKGVKAGETPNIRLARLNAVYAQSSIVDGRWQRTRPGDATARVLPAVVNPTLAAVSADDAPLMKLSLEDVLSDSGNPKPEDAPYKDVQELFGQVTRLRLAGAELTNPNYAAHAWKKEFYATVASSNALRAARMIVPFATSTVGSYPGWERVDMIRKVQKTFNDEILFVFANLESSSPQPECAQLASQIRGEVSARIPGVYPVSEKDPSYPLYVAADELAHKNPERAWELLSQRNNLTTFERVASKLPPDFVAWAVDNIRLARGAKDELLLKARQIATAVLQDESKITRELAAQMVLVRAETYRDQQNFEAARLEYQTVREGPQYRGTKAARKAMFRAVDLMIATGNQQGAEPILEYWLSQSDVEIQAEAHYFLALIAFDRKDYDETIKQLRQVFAIDFTHTEARLLQGKWKLATNSEVDETEVLIGSLADRTVVRPGQQLSINVQDSNLSVAGGGASIPVIVTTTPGGDRERISLYPSPRDPALFKGVASVELGKAVVSNLTLEVRGDDTVEYVIDPEFLKVRGLPLNTPKRLKVIDDARLAVGVGAPKSEDEKGGQDALAQMESDAASGAERRLRPGNPLYVVVRDRDEARSEKGSQVKVNVMTTSGDRLDDLELTEEKPFTGVFRAKIPTALPPPRALASDTAAGFNPGDAINSGKTGEWRSLADSQPGKWFAVDTMSSHQVAGSRLVTSSAGDIRALRLVGNLAGRDIVLGTLPVVPVAQKAGLRLQQANGVSFQSLDTARAYFATSRAPKKETVTNLSQSVRWGGHRHAETAFFSGPFLMPEGYDTLRFRIVAKNTKCAAPLAGLTLRVAVDGDQIFNGGGRNAHGRAFSCDITPGCHFLEITGTTQAPTDAYDLIWEPFGQDPRPVPADWFDVMKHPMLLEYMRDLATIEQKDDSFVATLKKPVRLRTVRWEFTDVKSPDVRVQKLYVTDAAGTDVIPVASDFSDAASNKTLEVAPGDKITVSYTDERTSSGEKKIIQRQIGSSFTDAKIDFIYEAADRQGVLKSYTAYRFRPGDSLVICLKDTDLDETDEADRVKVSVSCLSSGKSYGKTLLETVPVWASADRSAFGVHSGVFLGLLRTVRAGTENAPKNAIPVADDDVLTVSYEDRENTDPGVPTARTAKIQSVSATKPEITFFDVTRERVPDHSIEAKAALERIRRRPGNENVQILYRDELQAVPMKKEICASTNPIPVNVVAPIPVRVNDPSAARSEASVATLQVCAESELKAAEADGRDPEKIKIPLALNGSFGAIRLRRGSESPKEARQAGSFNGLINLSLGPIDPNIEVPVNAPPLLSVTGSDLIHLTLLDEAGEAVSERTLKLVSNGSIDLTDSSFAAARESTHIGEFFFVRVDDPDRDLTDEPDKIEIEAVSANTGLKRPVVLTESMPHSGVFTGRLRPVLFAPGEVIPSVATGGVASAHEKLTEERFSVRYGDRVIFRYDDSVTLPGTPARTLAVTGTVFRGSNGDVRLFSKRFTSRDNAVLVQFRLAECLFEQAKDFRKLKQTEKSSAAIDEGKFILEEALKNFPDSIHVVQGEFLLANLYQELGAEKLDAKDEDGARPLFQEALARFSAILSTWPDGEFAAKSQFHKAFCLEKLGDYARASEEYVKMTYLYPESDLVGDATIRLATYYYTKEKKYDISGHIYRNFQRRFPQHEKAARALFMAGSCYIKQAETLQAEVARRTEAKEKLDPKMPDRIRGLYSDAAKTFDDLLAAYDGTSYINLRAQAMYWSGDVAVRRGDYRAAYRSLKRCVLEYPETEWARRARGLLLQESKAFENIDE